MRWTSLIFLRLFRFVVLACPLATAGAGPVQVWFAEQQASNPKLDRSYFKAQFPAGTEASSAESGRAPLTEFSVFVLASDITLGFDRPKFKVDAAILPTNINLDFFAAYPSTQALWLQRLKDHTKAFELLQAAAKTKGSLSMGSDTLTVDLDPKKKPNGWGEQNFPKLVCLIATDYPRSGSIAERDFFRFATMASSIQRCLESLDHLGARSVVLPLIGSASGFTTKSMINTDQKARGLLQCRMQNSLVGIALGVNRFLPGRRSIQEVGVIQFTDDIEKQFSGGSPPKWDAPKYVSFAESSENFFMKALQGIVPTIGALPKDVDCNEIFGFGPGVRH